MAFSDVQSEVIDIVSRVTRYPKDILEPQVNFENELGIDSVKMGEIFAQIRKEYGLPDNLNIPEENLQTISNITTVLISLLPKDTAEDNKSQKKCLSEEIFNEVSISEIQRIVSENTRYPLEVLKADSDLENELGVDSVKMGEILAQIRTIYKLEEDKRVDSSSLNTIRKITDTLNVMLQNKDAN